jgi:hypothetical protein
MTTGNLQSGAAAGRSFVGSQLAGAFCWPAEWARASTLTYNSRRCVAKPKNHGRGRGVELPFDIADKVGAVED